MIKDSYKILFSLSVAHSYFEKGLWDCIQLLPGKTTKTLQKRFDIKMRMGINGLEVYLNSIGSATSLLTYITSVTDQDYFDFEIVTDPLLFWSVTDLPSNSVGQLIYDSQLSVPKDKTTSILKPTLSDEPCLKNSGNVKIRFADIIKSESGKISFHIEFQAKSTQWNYYIINKSKIKLNKPGIAEKANSISFEGPESVTTQEGISAIRFSSGGHLLPLSQVPKYKFDLVDDASGGTSGAKPIYKGLPNPDPIRTDIVQVNGKNVFASPMYIYI